MELTATEALALRMRSLLLTPRPESSSDVASVVSWLGAMQAQDLASGVWSLGVRLPGRTAADVADALERREALRTWPMRGTVHLVPSRDAHWMLDLMGVRTLAGAAARRAALGLSDDDVERAIAALGTALHGGGRLTRAQCLTVITDAGVDCSGQRGYHLLWYASQRGLTCIAPNVGKEQTFVLLDEWVPDPVRLDRDEALATIALRYFRGHGPTSRKDFAGWTGLPAVDARQGIAGAGAALRTVRVEGQEMYAAAEVLDAGPSAVEGNSVEGYLALPGFDEYMLGYKERSLMLEPEHMKAIIPGGNGVFQSTIVRGGRVVGLWKKSALKNRVVVRVTPLISLRAKDRAGAEHALASYGQFMEQRLEIQWS